MRLFHARAAISVRFDDPNLVSCAGLVPVMALAAWCGLTVLLVEGLTLAGKGTANAAAKITAMIAGMIAGADSISDMDLLRHGGLGRVFDGVRAPSTLGTFLRRFTFGHVRQLDAVAAGLLARLAAATPLLPGADQIAFVDIRRHRAPDLRLRQARRRARLHRYEGLERVARGALRPDLSSSDRRDPIAQGDISFRNLDVETAVDLAVIP